MFIVSGECAKLHLASTQALLNWNKDIFHMNIIDLKFPTGGRQTSWLFNNYTRVYRETTPAWWSELDFNLRPPDFNSAALITLPRCLISCERALAGWVWPQLESAEKKLGDTVKWPRQNGVGVVKDQQLTLEKLEIHKIAKAVIFQLRLSLTRQLRTQFLQKKN